MSKRIIAADCETDPFEYQQEVQPFIWGAYDGEFYVFHSTPEFVDWCKEQNAIVYMHNGGKFDFLFLLEFMSPGSIKIINGRIVKCKIGKATLQDSYSIMPVPLKAYEKDDFDYSWLLKENRQKMMPKIISYLKNDCKYLHEMVLGYREYGGTKMTLASNALSYAQSLNIPIEKTTKRFDKIFRDFYFGGRCQAFKPGHHKNVDILDIKSAYPEAMMFPHIHGSEFREIDYIPDGDKIFRCFIDVNCFSDGAFPQRTKTGLSFPKSSGRFFVSGWEYATAARWGLIKDVKINSVYQFLNTIDFSPYINHWYKIKADAEKAGDKLLRLIAKLFLNSLYGKMAQNPEKFQDFKIVPGGSEIEEGWELHAECSDMEIHCTPKYPGGMEDWCRDFYNVATGASITGFVRAKLLDAIMAVGRDTVIYCDTDSIFTTSMDTSMLDKSGILGSWDLEAHADECYIAGKKMYAAFLNDGSEKTASKGVNLNADEIKSIALGATLIYNKPSPTFKLDGSQQFISRKIKATGEIAVA